MKYAPPVPYISASGLDFEDGLPNRRHELVKIAADLFSRRGYRATTVRSIADSAGILSGSLYHHFSSKEEILDVLLRSYLNVALNSYTEIANSDAGPLEQVEALIRAAVRPLVEHRAAILLLQQEQSYLAESERFEYIGKFGRRIEKIWSDSFTRGILRGEFRRELDCLLPYYLVRDGVVSAARWFDPAGRLSLDALAEQYVVLLTRGISANNK